MNKFMIAAYVSSALLLSNYAYAQSTSVARKGNADTEMTTAKKRTASPKLLACAADWKAAKANPAVKSAGWINFWSACAKRRAAEFPSKARKGSAPSEG